MTMKKTRIQQLTDPMVHVEEATIANGATTSGEVFVGGLVPVAIYTPTMTGTAITFQRDDGDGTFATVNGVSLTVAAGEWVPLTDAWEGMQLGHNFKMVSGSTEGGERTLKVAMRAL